MRAPDWPERLAELVESCRGRPFAWGEHDCASFAAAAVHAVSGRVVSLPAHGSEMAAMRAIAAHGSLVAAAVAVLGASLAPSLARRGDIVVVSNGGREVLGVCLGTVAAAPGPDGLAFVPMADATDCWRID